MRNKQNWAVLPYNSKRINDKYLISNLLGSWSIFDRKVFLNLEQFRLSESSPLFKRLYQEGIIVKEDNLPKLINEFRNINANLFTDASLHIAVVTTRCNLACRYCQTKTERPEDMNFEVAAKILKYIFDMRNPYINLEFQGGEPLLNWKVVKFLIENARKFNTTGKDFHIGIVTNAVYLDEKKINFLVDNDVNICISLDGPAQIHNKNRIFKNNEATYKKVVTAIKRLKRIYKKRRINKPLDLLPTITKYSLFFPEKIIDEYVNWGAEQIALRPVNKIGFAEERWRNLGYPPEEFNCFWAKAMDYILKLNRKGVRIKERLALVMLRKILKKENAGYVDLMNPCGAGRSVLVYMPNGDIYPCDEARMAGSDIFKLGNILKNEYEELIKSSSLFSICEASLIDLWDYNSAYSPWMGTCPVLNYILGDNLIPKITTTPLYKIYRFQFDYLFKKMVEDKKNEEIFWQWLK
jgi:His-Xaa-Ser system radical SAM maturase HxsB